VLWHAYPRAVGISFGALAIFACKGAERPRPPAAVAQTLAVGGDGVTLRGVAGDGEHFYAALARRATVSDGSSDAPAATSTIEARRGDVVTWRSTIGGTAGELAIAGPLLAVTLSGAGTLDIRGPLVLRGDPAAVLAALDRTTGAARWRLAFDSTEWALLTSVAASGDDLVVGGSFGGTLRVGARVVSSAGGSDGFVARISRAGQVAWLVRFGGSGADAVQGVATHGTRIAIAGTFTSGADLLGEPLTAVDERSPFGDAFVAELDGKGSRRWHATFGGRADDTVAGVAIDSRGRIVVAGSVRDVVRVGSTMHVAQGASDGLVVWYGDDGELGANVLVGGADFDGVRAITALDDHVVIGGFFSGTIKLGERTLAAGGGDDSFLAALDSSGTIAASWHVGGAGREEITSLATIPGGFIAGVAHTKAASIDESSLAAPRERTSGSALVVRGL
jgi:hypothetical protein